MTDAMLDVAIKRAVAAIAVYISGAVAERRVAGELDFHDLLVLARTLLRDPEHGAAARDRLRRRYQRILIDEFQDTDPIQVELAALLGSGDAADGARPWPEMTIESGRLFFVGDPKQSIYRFRRADIATFLAAQERFADPAPLFLTCNFRTAPAVLAWINHVFAELIQAFPASQPEYRALDAARPVPPEHDRGVVLLGVEPHADDGIDAAELRVREAADVAAIARAAVAEQWPVFDRDTEAWRPARLGDVCILLPARTSLGYLEQALAEAGVPYRAETSSLVYSSREIRDLLMTLRAVDDSSNALALVSALRSSVFGCGDDDLFTYHVEHGGRWNVAAPLSPEIPADHPVAEAMRFLGELHAERVWSTPSELLERIVRERSVIEIGALAGRFRDVARRVRFLVDQARAYTDAVGGTLRDYLAWAEMQGAEGARVVESVVPETDDDAVRIMTIHGAKGLEFPIVVCSGMTTQAQVASRGVDVLFPPTGGCEVKMAKGVQTAEFELYKPIDEQMGFHEKLRMLYVACTRARDHLVVSVHRKARERKPDQTRWTHAELLWEAARHAPWREPDAPDAQSRPSAAASGGGAGRGRRSRRVGRRVRARARARQPARVRLRHRARAPPRPRSVRGADRDRSRPRQGRPRPRAAAVEQGPVRHRDRSGGARHAADRRPRDRLGSGGDRRGAGRGRRRARARADDRSAHPGRARGPGRAAGRVASALARDLRRGPVRRHHARGLRRPRVPRRRRPGGRRLQDRLGRREHAAKNVSSNIASRPRRTRSRSRRPPANRSSGVCSRSSSPRAQSRSSSRAPTSRPPSTRSGCCWPPSASTPRRRLRSCRPRADRGEPGAPGAVCHPGSTREAPEVLPQIRRDRRGGKRRDRRFRDPARPRGPAPGQGDHPDRAARAGHRRPLGPVARLRPQRQRDGDLRQGGPFAGQAGEHPDGVAAGRDLDRGPQVLRAPRRRLGRHGPRVVQERRRGRHLPGWLHHHPAAREEHVQREPQA